MQFIVMDQIEIIPADEVLNFVDPPSNRYTAGVIIKIDFFAFGQVTKSILIKVSSFPIAPSFVDEL